MKTRYIICLGLAYAANASAQAPMPPPVIIERPATGMTDPSAEATIEGSEPVLVDPVTEAAALRRLECGAGASASGDRSVELPPVEPGLVETTTTTVETPGLPPRVYQSERNIVIVDGRELPYLTIPVLFVEGSADLLDEQSRLAIEDTAEAIRDVLIANPTAVFDVEGHTSTDGSDEMNMTLSADRSRRIYTELIEHYGIPTSALAAHGYGENYAAYPDGTEAQMVQDRRVLVVRVK